MKRSWRLGSPARAAILFCLLSPQLYPASQPDESETLRRNKLTGRRGGNLVVAVNSDPSNFNRMLTASLAHATIIDRLSGDLVHVNRATTELEPALAKSWEASKDGRVYTIRLRRGLRFSDGSPFSADDVVFTFNVLGDPKTGAFIAGQVRGDDSFPRISKIDDYTVRLTYERPVGMGLRSLDSVPILPRSRLLKAYADGSLAAAWGPNASPKDIAGMGPFRLREYRRGERIVLERNPHFWITDSAGQRLPYLDTITFVIIPDRNTESLRFQAGEIHAVSLLSPEAYAALMRSANGDRFVLRNLGPGLAMDFLWFNLNSPEKRPSKSGADGEKFGLFARPEFRQAISLALDRAGIAKSVFLGLATPQAGPISSGNNAWHDRSLLPTPYDPQRSSQLLRKIGLSDSNGDDILEYGRDRRPLEITLFTARGSSAREKTAQIIRDNLLRIGVRAEIQLLLPNELGARLTGTLDYEAILFGLTPTDIVPDLQTDLWYSRGKNHFWAPEQTQPQTPWEAELDGLIARLVRSLVPVERKEAFNRFQAVWAREMPAIPTVAPNVLVAWARRVGNLKPAVLPPHLLWNAEELTLQPN